MFDDEDDDFYGVGDTAAKFHLVNAVILFFGALRDITRAFVNIFDNIIRVLTMHHNYRTKIDHMRDTTLLEIEALPTSEDGE